MKQHHKIEIFTANCPLCKQVIDDIEIGKCKDGIQIVYNVNEVTEELRKKINNMGLLQFRLLLWMTKSKL